MHASAGQSGGTVFQAVPECHLSRAWKETTNIPVSQKPHDQAINDFRPVIFMSILYKCMERVVSWYLTTMVGKSLDPLQFAYKVKWGVDDADLTLLDTVARHLDSLSSYVRILFMDFSSAFNIENKQTSALPQGLINTTQFSSYGLRSFQRTDPNML